MVPSTRRLITLIVTVLAVIALMLVTSGAMEAIIEGKTGEPRDEDEPMGHGCRPPPTEDQVEDKRSNRTLTPPPLEDGGPLLTRRMRRVMAPPDETEEDERLPSLEELGALRDTAILLEGERSVELSERVILPAPQLGDVRSPSLSPFAAQVAFEQGGQGLFVVTLDAVMGAAPTRIEVPDPASTAPRRYTWAPDGGLVFEARLPEPRLYVGVPGAHSQELIAEVDQVGAMTSPAQSRDRRWLAFVSNTHGRGTVRLRDADTEAILDLGEARADEDAPAFDRLGQRIAFERDGEIVVADVKSRSPIAVLGGEGTRARPAFAGDWVIYLRRLPEAASWALVRASVEGASERVLASGVRLPETAGLGVHPDGSVVAVAWMELGRTGTVTLIDVETTAAVDVRTGLVDVAEPSLGERDGQQVIVFTARQSAESPHRDLVVGTLVDAMP